MKRSAPTPVQLTAQIETPCVSFGVIRTALIGMSCVVLLLLGLFCFLFLRTHTDTPIVAPSTANAPLRMASTVPTPHQTE